MTTLKESYPKDTIGYHYLIARAVFGEGSKPVVWLEKKAQESPNYFDEGVIANEEQVVHLLIQMFLDEVDSQPLGLPL